MASPSIQSASGNIGNGGSGTVTFSGAQTAGNTNVLVVGYDQVITGTEVSIPTDSAGNTYVLSSFQNGRPEGGFSWFFFTCVGIASHGTGNVVSFVWTGVEFVDAVIIEYPKTGPVYTSNGGNRFGGGSTTVNTTLSGTIVGDLVVMVGWDNANSANTQTTAGAVGANTANIVAHPSGDNWAVQDGLSDGSSPMTVSVGSGTDDWWSCAAISFLPPTAIVIRGSVTRSTSSGVIITPTGVQSGDVLVAVLGNIGNADTMVTVPSGWTQQEFIQHTAVTDDNMCAWVFTYVCGGSTPGTHTFVTAQSFTPTSGTCGAYINVDNTTPWDAGSTIVGGNATPPTGAGFTPGATNAMLLWLYYGDNLFISSGPSGGFTTRVDGTTNTNPCAGLQSNAPQGWYEKRLGAIAATGNIAATGASGDDWLVSLGALVVALTGTLFDISVSDTPAVSDGAGLDNTFSRTLGNIQRIF
jgi:hypothetical protein